MKMLALVLVLTGLVLAQPTLDPEPVVDIVLKKLDSQTLEAKTTTTTVSTVKHDKQELVTELQHIADKRAAIQQRYDTEMDAVIEREAELIEMLKVLE